MNPLPSAKSIARKSQLNDLLERQHSGTLNSSLINEERKAGVPKISTEQHGKYGKKVPARTSLLQLKDEIRKKATTKPGAVAGQNSSTGMGTTTTVQTNTTLSSY